MRWSWMVLLAAAIGCGKAETTGDTSPAPVPKPVVSIEDELKRLAGDWKVVKVEGGRLRDKEHIVTFRGDQVTFLPSDGGIRVQIDPNQDPKWFDLTFPPESLMRPLHPGIYKLDGDRLSLYMITKFRDDEPPERPKSFQDKCPGQILHLERVRK